MISVIHSEGGPIDARFADLICAISWARGSGYNLEKAQSKAARGYAKGYASGRGGDEGEIE